MQIRRPFSLFWIPLACLLLAGAQCSVSNSNNNSGGSTTTTRVDTEQKISATAGGFNGNLNAGDEFGSALADVGDLNADSVTDLAVGAPYTDDNGADRGAVWILFMNKTGHVDTQQKISDGSGSFSGNLNDNDRFGSALARLTDLDLDGIPDLAVGAPGDDDGGADRGAVWILFMGRDGRVKSQQKIADGAGGFNGNLNDNDQFGGAVASVGDLDGDGVPDLAVGAPGDDDGGTDRGAVWILFMGRDGRVKSEQKIADGAGGFNGNLNDNDQFGGAVASVGDLDGDGTPDLAVGAPGDDEGGTDRGAVWILFMGRDGRVKSEQKIADGAGGFKGNLNDDEHFGAALSSLGDLAGSGIPSLAVGAPGNNDGGTNRGAVWLLFVDKTGRVTSDNRISSTSGGFKGKLQDGDEFGSAVAWIANLNGKGTSDLAVGAPLDDDGGTDEGAIWILFLKETSSNQ